MRIFSRAVVSEIIHRGGRTGRCRYILSRLLRCRRVRSDIDRLLTPVDCGLACIDGRGLDVSGGFFTLALRGRWLIVCGRWRYIGRVDDLTRAGSSTSAAADLPIVPLTRCSDRTAATCLSAVAFKYIGPYILVTSTYRTATLTGICRTLCHASSSKRCRTACPGPSQYHGARLCNQ